MSAQLLALDERDLWARFHSDERSSRRA